MRHVYSYVAPHTVYQGVSQVTARRPCDTADNYACTGLLCIFVNIPGAVLMTTANSMATTHLAGQATHRYVLSENDIIL